MTDPEGGNIIINWELWRATVNNEMIQDLTDWFVGGQVSLNHDRAISTQATIIVSDAAIVNPYTDYLAVFVSREYVDGRKTDREQIGLYTIGVPAGVRTVEAAEGTYTGNDLTAKLAARAFEDTYNIAASTNYIVAIEGIIGLTDITRYQIAPTPQALSAPKSFAVGTTYLDACNELLASIGYYHLSMTPTGRLVSMPSRNIEYTEPYRVLTPDDLMAPVIPQPTDTTVANVVIVVKDNLNEPPLTAVRRNDDPASPTSTVNLGVQSRTEIRAELTDQSAVDALADRLLSEGRTFYQTARTTILPDPGILQPHQTIDMQGTGRLSILDGRWWVRTATINFGTSGGCVVELNRVTDRIRGTIV